MKGRSTKNREADTNALAQEIFSVVRLFPPKLRLPDVSDVFERIGADPEKSSLGKIERFRGHWNDKPIKEPGKAELKEHETVLFAMRTILAIDSLLECFKGLPTTLTERLDFAPLDSERVYQLLKLNTWMGGSFEDFQERSRNDTEWLEAATQYAVVLDVCERYSTMRSWYQRLYRIAYIVSPIMTQSPDNIGKLYPAKNVFGISHLTLINGRISFEPDKFTTAFMNVEIDRIRLCGACEKVFWANRIDMKGCTVQCAKVLRTRKWRSKPENKLEEKIRSIKRDTKEKN